MKDENIKELENRIKQTSQPPLRNLPMSFVVETLSGHKVIPFDKENVQDRIVLAKLQEVAKLTTIEVNKHGILRSRANEVGNDIEPYVKNALIQIGYESDKPKTKGGKKKSTAYPDLYFVDEFGRVNYLECKTFNVKNVATTQRSFYFSPSEEFKVTADAHHFVISFEIYTDGRKEDKNIYKCKSWKLLSIENLEIDLKYEFLSNNKKLYAKEMILAEGNL